MCDDLVSLWPWAQLAFDLSPLAARDRTVARRVSAFCRAEIAVVLSTLRYPFTRVPTSQEHGSGDESRLRVTVRLSTWY
jgi:hypothetical protein